MLCQFCVHDMLQLPPSAKKILQVYGLIRFRHKNNKREAKQWPLASKSDVFLEGQSLPFEEDFKPQYFLIIALRPCQYPPAQRREVGTDRSARFGVLFTDLFDQFFDLFKESS